MSSNQEDSRSILPTGDDELEFCNLLKYYFWGMISCYPNILSEAFVRYFYSKLDLLLVVKYSKLNEEILRNIIQFSLIGNKDPQYIKKLVKKIYSYQDVSIEFAKKYRYLLYYKEC